MSKLGLIFHLELHQEPWGCKELMTERFRGVLYWLRMAKAAKSRISLGSKDIQFSDQQDWK